MSKRRECILGILFAAGTLLGARGCGGVTDDRVAAREKTAAAICDRYKGCDLIGTGAPGGFATREACIINWRADRDDAWPASECQGRISQPDLDVCLSAIGGTACMGFDFVTTLLKCTPVTVCSAGTPRDAGGN